MTLFRCPQTGLMRDFEKERARDNHRCEQIRLAAESLRQDEIARTCARYELESDEFFTAEEKALKILARA